MKYSIILISETSISLARTLKTELSEINEGATVTIYHKGELDGCTNISFYAPEFSVGYNYALEKGIPILNNPVYDLNIAEAAILAGMLKAPSKLNPMKNLDASLNRMGIDYIDSYLFLDDIYYI